MYFTGVNEWHACVIVCHTNKYMAHMAHVWMGHGTICMNRLLFAWSKAYKSQVTHTNESWRTYEWVMAHVRMSHGAICMKRLLFASTDSSSHEARHVWVMSQVWMSHGTYINESWHIHAWICSSSHEARHVWVMSHVGMSHGPRRIESWHTDK